MKVKQTEKMLKCILTDDEIRDYGAGLARKYSEISDLEEQKKSVTSDFKARIDSANADASIYARKIQNGYEFRDVPCEIQYLDDEKIVQIVRIDTHDIIDIRSMTPDELQSHLFKEDDNHETTPEP